MNILVLNCGSSSVKFQIIVTDSEHIREDTDRQLARGLIERWGDRANIKLQVEGQSPVKLAKPVRDQEQAIERILDWICSPEAKLDGIRSLTDIHAVGHRVVHGGEEFKNSVRIDEEVLLGIEKCSELAPLHNPWNLIGIRAVDQILGIEVPQVAVFDTAFHSTLPEVSFLYGLPYEYYQRHKIRRYGFHGTSYRYVTYRYRNLLGISRDEVNLITLHLGNGCSACAIKNGRSFDTSMGFTPLEGLLMGTRCGDIDSSILEYLASRENMTLTQLSSMLNTRSGLLGLSGLAPDMRTLLEEECRGNPRAGLAIDLFCYRAQKYIGAYLVALQTADAIVFTGGIGENSPVIRKRICDGLHRFGLQLDPHKNDELYGGKLGEISTQDSYPKAYVIPTTEELLIARDTYRVVSGALED